MLRASISCSFLCETIGAKTPIGEQDPHVEVKVSVGRDGVVCAFFSQSPDKGLWGNCFVEQAPFFRLVCEFLGITDLSKGEAVDRRGAEGDDRCLLLNSQKSRSRWTPRRGCPRFMKS